MYDNIFCAKNQGYFSFLFGYLSILRTYASWANIGHLDAKSGNFRPLNPLNPPYQGDFKAVISVLYSKTRNYLYTHKMARIQSSPAAVGYLFLDKLKVFNTYIFSELFWKGGVQSNNAILKSDVCCENSAQAL